MSEVVRVRFLGIFDKRPGRHNALSKSIYRGGDRGTGCGFAAVIGKEIEGGISRTEFNALCADFPGAFEIIEDEPKKEQAPVVVIKKKPGRPRGSKNKPKRRKAKKKAKPKTAPPSSLPTG